MADIRKPTPKGALNLPTVGDFEKWYRFEDGTDFPAGFKLYFLLGDPDEAQIRWDFAITGGTAYLKVESEVVATIAERTKFWLMTSPAVTAPTTEFELLTGVVKKVNAK